MPERSDENPWVKVVLKEAVTVSQIKIMEGKFGSSSFVEEYVLEALVSGKWIPVHSGKEIGGDLNAILKDQVFSDTFRLRFIKWNGQIRVNSFELY